MAVSITADVLATAIGADITTAARLLVMSIETVERHMGNDYDDTPDSILDEAVIRHCGWLYAHPSDGLTLTTIGDFSARFSGPSALSPLRYSGAEAVLGPWKKRRGVTI